MRTAVIWVEGVLSEDLSLTRSQMQTEGMVFLRTLLFSPSAYNFILASNVTGEVVEHWLRTHGLDDMRSHAVETVWGLPKVDEVKTIVTTMTAHNRHDIRLWVDSNPSRCNEALVRYGISVVQVSFSRQGLAWVHEETGTAFAPISPDVDD